jgi:hypothetical protein
MVPWAEKALGRHVPLRIEMTERFAVRAETMVSSSRFERTPDPRDDGGELDAAS